MTGNRNLIKQMKASGILVSIMLFAGLSCGQQKRTENQITMSTTQEKQGLQLATFGSGCFWCTEAIFQRVDGISKVVSGYTGGKVKNPTYKEVCSGLTGHAEVIQLTYDPKKISFEELLEIFWQTHDPTTLNKQGADVGTQYRSAVFFHTEEQRKLALEFKKKLDESGAFDNPIVTEISPIGEFYAAEDYHQNYYNLNGNAPYCSYVIQPKLDKFKKVFANKLKK